MSIEETAVNIPRGGRTFQQLGPGTTSGIDFALAISMPGVRWRAGLGLYASIVPEMVARAKLNQHNNKSRELPSAALRG